MLFFAKEIFAGRSAKMSANKKELFRALKYFLIAISAGLIQLAASFLLELVIFKKVIPEGETLFFVVELDKSSFLAESIGLALSIIWNFTFNRKYTFKAATNVPRSMALAFLFYVPFYPFQIWYINAVRAALLNALGEDFAFVAAQVTIMLINGVLEFLWQRFVVFGKKTDSAIDGNANAASCSDEVQAMENNAEQTLNAAGVETEK